MGQTPVVTEPTQTLLFDVEAAPTEAKAPKAVLEGSNTIITGEAASSDCLRFWARGEYLLGWVKNAPMPEAIITIGDPNVGFNGGVGVVNSAGAIGQPGTQVVFGNSSIDYGTINGMRFTLGGWLDSEGLVGLEGTGFLFERRVSQFAATSNGDPALYFPIDSGFAGAPRGIPIADSLRQFVGDVFATSTFEFWGAELNGCFSLCRQPCRETVLLVGFRYLDLKENFHVHNSTIDTLFNNLQVHDDQFDTRNQFYGGQIGLRSSYRRNDLTLNMTGKLAFGSTHEVVSINGAIGQTAFPPTSAPGGIYTQSSNIGRYTANQFGVVPAFEIKLGYQVTPRLNAFVGYDILYWNQVVRPGNQINRNVNLTQNGVLDPNATGILVGPNVPTPFFNRSDFWAQALSFGLELRY
jgi:hypothetical protein